MPSDLSLTNNSYLESTNLRKVSSGSSGGVANGTAANGARDIEAAAEEQETQILIEGDCSQKQQQKL